MRQAVVAWPGTLLAWRWQNGWPPLKEEKTIEMTENLLDEHRNRAIRGMLPALIMIAIYEKFRHGKGHGITSLVEELRLPYAWCYDAINLLRELGLIAPAKVIQADKTEAEQFLPTHPPEKISFKDLTNMTDAPVTEWLDAWEPMTSDSLKSFKRTAKSTGLDFHRVENMTFATVVH